MLNLWSQEHHVIKPEYKIGGKKGEDHNPIFTACSIKLDKREYKINGHFKNKKEAKQAIAKHVYEKMTVQPTDESEGFIFMNVEPRTPNTCHWVEYPLVSQKDMIGMSLKGADVHCYCRADFFSEELHKHVTVHEDQVTSYSRYISWWLLNDRDRLMKKNTKVILHSNDPWASELVTWCSLAGINIQLKQ